MVKSASFCKLLTHITSFDIFRNFIKETERWTIFGKGVPGRREKLRKNVARKSHGTGPMHHGRTTRDRHNWPGNQVARPGRATWHDRAMWHPRATCAMLGWFFWQIFGTVTPCLWARPCHPRSASRLKSSLGAVSGGEFSFSFSIPKTLLGDF